jgi:hypothetical protein
MKGVMRRSLGSALNRFGSGGKEAGGLLKAGGCIILIILLLTGCSLNPQYVSVAFETNSDDAVASAEGLREGDLIPEPAVPEKS